MNENWPEAYKKGVQNFYGRDFLVSPAVLIPRPETEMMIDEVLALAGKAYLPGIKTPERKLSENPVILDVGTGSGCVATTIKLEIPEAKVIGLDVSAEALKVARQNAEKLGADVEFIRSDLLSNYKGENPDVVVANLPYYITTPILMKLLEEEPGLSLIEIMVQKEVADRICAEPTGREFGAITVAVNYYAEPRYMQTVPSFAFLPPPATITSAYCS